MFVADATEMYVTSQDELYELMDLGAQNRAIAATGMNEGSSRSHSVFTVKVAQRNHETSVSKTGKLVLVDLAGTTSQTGNSSNSRQQS